MTTTTDSNEGPAPHVDMTDLEAREHELHELTNEPYSGTHLQDHEKDARVFQIAFTAIDEVRRLRKLVVSDANAGSAKKTRLGLILTIVVGVLSAGAMVSSCANSGINYRQMRAIETLAEHAKDCGR